MTQVLIFYLAVLTGVLVGWFLASLSWAAARADLEMEVMEQRRRIWNLTRDEHHA